MAKRGKFHTFVSLNNEYYSNNYNELVKDKIENISKDIKPIIFDKTNNDNKIIINNQQFGGLTSIKNNEIYNGNKKIQNLISPEKNSLLEYEYIPCTNIVKLVSHIVNSNSNNFVIKFDGYTSFKLNGKNIVLSGSLLDKFTNIKDHLLLYTATYGSYNISFIEILMFFVLFKINHYDLFFEGNISDFESNFSAISTYYASSSNHKNNKIYFTLSISENIKQYIQTLIDIHNFSKIKTSMAHADNANYFDIISAAFAKYPNDVKINIINTCSKFNLSNGQVLNIYDSAGQKEFYNKEQYVNEYCHDYIVDKSLINIPSSIYNTQANINSRNLIELINSYGNINCVYNDTTVHYPYRYEEFTKYIDYDNNLTCYLTIDNAHLELISAGVINIDDDISSVNELEIPEIVGPTDNTGAYLQHFSRVLVITRGKEAVFKFKNYGSGNNFWNNFVVCANKGTQIVINHLEFALRADRWENIQSSNQNITDNIDFTPAIFNEELYGSTVIVTVKYYADRLIVRADIEGKNKFKPSENYKYKPILNNTNPVKSFIPIYTKNYALYDSTTYASVYNEEYTKSNITGNITVCIGIDQSHIDLLESGIYNINSNENKITKYNPIITIGNTDNTTAHVSAGSYTTPLKLKDGQKAIFKFRNYSSKTNNWNNFYTFIGQEIFSTNNLLVAFRADAWENVSGSNSGITNNYNWSTFKNDLDGAYVKVTVTYINNTVNIKCDIVNDVINNNEILKYDIYSSDIWNKLRITLINTEIINKQHSFYKNDVDLHYTGALYNDSQTSSFAINFNQMTEIHPGMWQILLDYDDINTEVRDHLGYLYINLPFDQNEQKFHDNILIKLERLYNTLVPNKWFKYTPNTSFYSATYKNDNDINYYKYTCNNFNKILIPIKNSGVSIKSKIVYSVSEDKIINQYNAIISALCGCSNSPNDLGTYYNWDAYYNNSPYPQNGIMIQCTTNSSLFNNNQTTSSTYYDVYGNKINNNMLVNYNIIGSDIFNNIKKCNLFNNLQQRNTLINTNYTLFKSNRKFIKNLCAFPIQLINKEYNTNELLNMENSDLWSEISTEELHIHYVNKKHIKSTNYITTVLKIFKLKTITSFDAYIWYFKPY